MRVLRGGPTGPSNQQPPRSPAPSSCVLGRQYVSRNVGTRYCHLSDASTCEIYRCGVPACALVPLSRAPIIKLYDPVTIPSARRRVGCRCRASASPGGGARAGGVRSRTRPLASRGQGPGEIGCSGPQWQCSLSSGSASRCQCAVRQWSREIGLREGSNRFGSEIAGCRGVERNDESASRFL